MKLSIHAKEQLIERYTDWGLDIPEAFKIIDNLSPENEKFRMLIIDDIPLVLICDFDEIITIYPHPIDAAENWIEMLELVRVLRKKARLCDRQVKQIESLSKKLKKQKQQLREGWE